MKHFRWIAATAGIVLATALGAVGLVGAADSASGQTAQTLTTYACTDTATDGTTINSDLTSLQQGGTLLLSGTCDAGTITVPQGVTLEGTGGMTSVGGTIIDGTISETDAGPVVIQELQVNCEGAENAAGLTLDGHDLTIEHMKITDCTYGIELYSASGTGNHVNDQINDNFINDTQSGSSFGFYVYDLGNGITDGHFDDNYVAVAPGVNAIEMTNAAGWYIDDNHTYSLVDDLPGVGIYAQRMYGTQISGNYIAGWTGYGIEGTVQGGAIASVVSGNNVLQDPEGTVGGTDPAGNGIELSASSTCSSSTECFAAVTGNAVINTNDSTSAYGIQGSGTGLVFSSSGNLVRGAANTSGAVSGATEVSGS
jgi:hypothetical protein